MKEKEKTHPKTPVSRDKNTAAITHQIHSGAYFINEFLGIST
jgi:hypothetical protein